MISRVYTYILQSLKTDLTWKQSGSSPHACSSRVLHREEGSPHVHPALGRFALGKGVEEQRKEQKGVLLGVFRGSAGGSRWCWQGLEEKGGVGWGFWTSPLGPVMTAR